MNRRMGLGSLVKIHREYKGLSQENIAENCGVKTNRSAIAHLEQGLRLPRPQILQAICTYLDIPKPMWESFTRDQSVLRFEFEDILTELTGRVSDIEGHEDSSVSAVESLIQKIFNLNPSPEQLYDLFNSILVYYGAGPVTDCFFKKYFDPSSFGSIESFRSAVDQYQIDAIRIFPTFTEAFDKMSCSSGIDNILKVLEKSNLAPYQARNEWTGIKSIPDDSLPDLGYISAKTVRQESAERQWLIEQIKQLADKLENGQPLDLIIKDLSAKKRNKIDTLLRKFDSVLAHGMSSPLFNYDYDFLRRESERLAPLNEDRLAKMELTQKQALENLSVYLSADHMDLYIATSMRSNADYVSVNHFVRELFDHKLIRPLKLRFFNPTQSWIDDRVAKGLVEALMLKRASVTIYMAQKSDTFGKDSEASVALGQGKPVIVYVPKLNISNEDIDSEYLFKISRAELVKIHDNLPMPEEIDDTIDDEAIVATILFHKLIECTDETICECVRSMWADFDMYNESNRIPEELREEYRKWLDNIIDNESFLDIPSNVRKEIIGVIVAVSINFEKRAKVFREVHPLALQVILSSGVLNGILVARTINQCATVLESIIKNDLSLDMIKDEDNYRVVEKHTNSTIRVISRHQLLRNAFASYYKMKSFK